jgi:hypothetical protein
VTGVELSDGRVIARTAVFIRPGNAPHPDSLLSGLGCEVDQTGFITVPPAGQHLRYLGRRQRGRSPRSDNHRGRRRIAAAIAISTDLVQEDVERAAADRAASGVPAAAMAARL